MKWAARFTGSNRGSPHGFTPWSRMQTTETAMIARYVRWDEDKKKHQPECNYFNEEEYQPPPIFRQGPRMVNWCTHAKSPISKLSAFGLRNPHSPVVGDLLTCEGKFSKCPIGYKGKRQ